MNILRDLRREHIKSLGTYIYICQAKNDQEGEISDFPKHVFANPVMPEICPVLAIGIYFLVIRFEPNQSKLFEGSKRCCCFIGAGSSLILNWNNLHE